MAKFWTADLHLKHKAILRHCPHRKETFGTIDKMDADLIKRHNEVVKPDDEVWVIGDFAWPKADQNHFYTSTLEKMNGTKHLVLGNHDECKPFYYVNAGFASVHTANIIKIGDYKVCMAHDPSVWNAVPNDMIFLCGHIHLMFKALPKQRIVNVGVDAWDYYPVSWEQIINLLTTHKDEEKLNI